MKNKEIAIILGTVLTIGILRLFIPIPNFSPIGALALTGGYFLGKNKFAYMLPLGGLFISDLFLGMLKQSYFEYLFSSSFILVYLAFVITIIIGTLARKYKINSILGLVGTSILASVVFFLLTNFGSWLYDPIYAKNLNGLIQSYIAGLAFYKYDIFGNLALNQFIATAFFTAIFAFAGKWFYAADKKRVLA